MGIGEFVTGNAILHHFLYQIPAAMDPKRVSHRVRSHPVWSTRLWESWTMDLEMSSAGTKTGWASLCVNGDLATLPPTRTIPSFLKGISSLYFTFQSPNSVVLL